MKATIDIKPVFVQWSKFCSFFGIGGITILFWVICSMRPDELPTVFKKHESIHSWQQIALFVLGLSICAVISLVLGVFGILTPWWIWWAPILIPFVIYVASWLIEVVLPPYKRAYYDTCFEREAYLNEDNPNYSPTFFSAWRYILKSRK
jgi:hypothetical protein